MRSKIAHAKMLKISHLLVVIATARLAPVALGQAVPAPGPARIVQEYALISAYAREKYPDPKNWRLLGSNDGGQTWTLLDVRTNQAFRARSERRGYHIANQTAYNAYRLEIDGSANVQLAELELIGPLAGGTKESDLQILASSSKEHPLLGAASYAFDNDTTSRWIDFGTGTNSCWLQCQYTLQSQTLVTNVSQYIVLARRLAARNPLSEKAPQILANFTNQAPRPRRILAAYALTSANDFPNRDPRDWRLSGSNDRGDTWQVLDARRNEIFQERFQRRIFSLTNEAPYALYRLEIDCVRVPANLPGGASCVQLAEIEPLYSAKDPGGKFSILVSAEGENPPVESIEDAFDGKANTKWLSFTQDTNTNRSSWVEWEYLPGADPPVMNLRWVKALQAQRPLPVELRLEGVVASWNPDANTIGLLDETGFQQFQLRSTGDPIHAGDRVRLAGRLELGQGLPFVSKPELTCLVPAATPQEITIGRTIESGPVFPFGVIEARVTSVSEDSAAWTTLGLASEQSPERMLARFRNPSHTRLTFFPGCRLRIQGVVQPVLDEDGRRVPGVIWAPDLAHVAVLAVTDKDWSEWPRYPLERLASATARVNLGSPVRFLGTVAQQDSNKVVVAGKGTNLLLAYSTTSAPLPAGSSVEALGFFNRENATPSVQLAQFRPAPSTKSQPAEGPPIGSEPLQPVTRIREVYEKLEEHPGKTFPVKLHGVITYIDQAFDSFYLQDGTDGIQVENQLDAGLAPHLRQEGSFVEVHGTVDPDQQAILPDRFVEFLGMGRMPEPRRHAWDYLMTGKDDSQWVQIEGVVSACGDVGLTVIVTGGRLAVVVNDFDKRAQDKLLGSLVRICGVCSPVRDNRNRRVSLQLFVPSIQFLEVLRPAPEDPFDVANRTIGSLVDQTSRSTNLTVRLVKTAGVVTYKEPRLLFIQDGGDGLRVFLRAETWVSVGDRVEAVGFAEPDGLSPKLVQAVARRMGQTALPEPTTLDLMGPDVTDLDATRVRVEATLVGQKTGKLLQVLELNDERADKTFSALIPVLAEALPVIPAGSRVRLTGVFRSETETMADLGQVPISFKMYLNSPQDIVVLHRPSWWNARHTLWVSAALGTILLLALTWASSLRNQVLQRTEQLHVEIGEHKRTEEALETSDRFMRSLVESLPQNIVRKDLAGHFTFANEYFCRTIGKPMDQVIGKTDFDLFPSELAGKFRHDDEQVIASGKLLETVEQNRNAGGENIYVQVVKAPLFDAGDQVIGVQIIFWDVTERKRAEARFEEAQRAMVDASRQAGMAEVASGVLHNVGNVLNSVNVSASLVSDNLQKSKVSGLGKAVALLREHETDLGAFFSTDPRGKQLTVYLARLAECLVGEQTAAMQELHTLKKNIEHIKEIVAMQQNYARVVGLTEKVKVTDLVEDALRLNSGTLARHEVELAREYEPELPEVIVERHKVLQILVNLIRNAKYACDESGRCDKRLVVRVTSGDGCVKISTTDNGIGIPPENLTRIFNHGFTTRKDGHGFGLHSGALAAKEMGGTLVAQSDGPGTGASFTLSLPLAPGTN